jgi:hypothetical protein
MKTLNNTILKVEHFATIRGEDITEVKIRIRGHVEEKYLEIKVKELDVDKTPKENIENMIDYLGRCTILCRTKKEYADLFSRIKGLEIALTYLN